MGFESGFGAGVLIAAVWLMANNPRSDRLQLTYGELLGMVATPIIHAVIGGLVVMAILGALCGGILAPETGFARETPAPFGERRVLLTLAAHVGLYLGGLVGTGRGVLRIRSRFITVICWSSLALSACNSRKTRLRVGLKFVAIESPQTDLIRYGATLSNQDL